MATYIDPFTDTGFKIIFGVDEQSNDILMEFLNDLFADREDFDRIVSIKYLNNEHIRDWRDGKTIVYDIFCTTSTGHRFIVEMQRNPQMNFINRAVYYVSRAIAEQGVRGASARKEIRAQGKDADYDTDGQPRAWDYGIIPVVGVFMCNFHVNGLEHKLVSHATISDTDTHQPIGNLTRYIFIQFSAFNKSVDECETDFDKWIYILKHMNTMQTIPFRSHKEIFDRLARVSNVATLTPEERRLYEYDLKKARDYAAEMEYAREESLKRGIAEGRAEGRAEGISYTIRALSQSGMSSEQISEILKIPVDEICVILNSSVS